MSFGQTGACLCLTVPFDKDRLGRALGRTSSAMAAITDIGFAEAIVKKLAALDPDVPVCVARELTKTFETYHRGPASRLAAEFAERAPKGEIVLLVGGVNAPRAVN